MVLTDSLLPAGAAYSGLPQGQVASLPVPPSGPVSPQAKDRCPTCSLGVQPCLSASGHRCQDSPGDHWVQIPRLPLAKPGLGPGCRFNGGVSVPGSPLTAGQCLSWLHLLSLPLHDVLPFLSSPGAETLPPHQTGTSWEPGVLSWGNHGSPEGGTSCGTTRLCPRGPRRM